MTTVGVVGLGAVGGTLSSVGLDRLAPEHLTGTPMRVFSAGYLPKDLDGLIEPAYRSGHPASLLEAVASFNRRIRGDRKAS